MKKRMILKLTDHQNDKLTEFFLDSFPNYSIDNRFTWGIILGHPDMNSGKIQFVPFRFHEHLILSAAMWIIKILRWDWEDTGNYDPEYGKWAYSLKEAEAE